MTAPRGAPRFTASEVATFFAVDPKTVHNWVARGALVGERTEGGHLRIRRAAVLVTARKFGFPVPREALTPPIRVSLALGESAAKSLAMRVLVPASSFSILSYAHPFDALVDFHRAEPEVVVVDPEEAPDLLTLAASRMPHLSFPSPPALVAFSSTGRVPEGFAGGTSHAEPGKLRAAVTAIFGDTDGSLTER